MRCRCVAQLEGNCGRMRLGAKASIRFAASKYDRGMASTALLPLNRTGILPNSFNTIQRYSSHRENCDSGRCHRSDKDD